MSYFVNRHKRHYLPLDVDSVIERHGEVEKFEVEGPDHPHVVIRSAKSADTKAARELTSELDEEVQGLAQMAVLINGIGGDFKLYAGSWDGEGWDWPKLETTKDAVRRCESLLKLDDIDLLEVADVAAGLAMLKPGEEKN